MYLNPTIPSVHASTTAIDLCISNIQTGLASLTWLTKSFGRAYAFRDEQLGGFLPKVYLNSGEYLNVLPNDFLGFQSFFALKGSEKYIEYSAGTTNVKECRLSIIFWGKLSSEAYGDRIYTQNLMQQVIAKLKVNKHVRTIEETWDERASDVFEGYDLSESTQYLMHPYGGFRIDVIVNYDETEC